jgi:hypothetical protein
MYWQIRNREEYEIEQQDLFSIMNKYSRAVDNENFENFLIVIFLDESTFDFSQNTCRKTLESYLTKNTIKNDKHFFIFEKVIHKIDSFALKGSVLKDDKKVTYEEFSDILLELMFEYNIDYEFSENSDDSIELFYNFLHIILKNKFKDFGKDFLFEGSKIKNNSKSKILGVENEYSVTWVL